MASNVDPIVAQIQTDFQSLLAFATGPESAALSAAAVERRIFRQLLALGAALLRAFFVTRAAVRPPAPTAPDGTILPYHDMRDRDYLSIFGKLTLTRHYFHAPGAHGIAPLDAALALPPRCYSDVLREWGCFDATDGAYRETQTTIGRILGLNLSLQALETAVADDAQDVDAFYAQPADPRAIQLFGTILVAQADGKGVPMVQPLDTAHAVRLGKGEKRSKKREAIVTAVYTIMPYHRTPEDVLAALFRDADHPAPAARRPLPVRKELRATLQGKAAALTALAARVAQRDGHFIRARVALTDGAEALQAQMRAHLPDHTLVLDIIHASEYLWQAGTALFGERSAERTPWVRAHLRQVLHGQVAQVITTLEAQVAAAGCTASQRTVLETVIGYYRRNAEYMRYDVYLAAGWPIGTGVVEGACGHLVKDRMEQAGMRWTEAGAQALLDLRAVRLNGDWDRYWAFHLARQQQRVYGKATVHPGSAPERVVLQSAA